MKTFRNPSPFGSPSLFEWRVHPSLLVFASLMLSVCFHAQEFPRPTPTEAHDVLAKEAGTWDATVKMYFQGPTGPVTESTGVETAEMICDGLYSRSTFNGRIGDRAFEGQGLFGYDARAKEYTGFWVDNFNAAPTLMTGTYDADAGTLTWSWTIPMDPAGEPIKQRQVTTFIDEQTKKTELFMTMNVGGQKRETKLMEILSKRRD